MAAPRITRLLAARLARAMVRRGFDEVGRDRIIADGWQEGLAP